MKDNQKDFQILSPEFLKEHAAQFMDIAVDIPLEAWTEPNYMYELPGKWTFSVVATDASGHVTGFIIASDKQGAVHIHKYAVHRDHRSQGLGLAMLQFFEKNVKRISCRRQVTLYVDEHNERAIAFYERNGFEFKERVENMFLFRKILKVVVAIHQPNFFPWLGFFDKMIQSDKFILLDHVTNRPNDAIYTKRVTIVCNSEEFWLTVPIAKPKGVEFVAINKMEVAKDNFDKKHLRTVETNYRKAPYFEAYFPLFESFYTNSTPLIAERNIATITAIAGELDIQTPLYLSSDFVTGTASTRLLIDLVKAVEGDIYLHGSMAVSDKGYQENDLFLKNGIMPAPQQFRHPEYRQYNNKNTFIKGASAMDALFNLGSHELKMLMNWNPAVSVSRKQ